MILGPAGAGKTVLAHRLSACTGLPVIHLDRIFWRSGWQPAPRDEALAELESALAGDRWIADGNFLDAGDTRFARADTVIFLDLPRALCIWRVLWRRVRDRGRERPDLPALEGFRPITPALDLELSANGVAACPRASERPAPAVAARGG